MRGTQFAFRTVNVLDVVHASLLVVSVPPGLCCCFLFPFSFLILFLDGCISCGQPVYLYFKKEKERNKQLIIYYIKISEINITSFLRDLFYFLSFEEGWNGNSDGEKCCVDRNQVASVQLEPGRAAIGQVLLLVAHLFCPSSPCFF